MRNLGSGLILAALACLGAVEAGAYPTRPVRLIIPFAPGGTSEVLARMIGTRMSEYFGQPVIIDSRPGASGVLGTGIAASAPPDGHTLLFTSLSPVVISVHMPGAKLPYDPEKNLTPISVITKVPSVFTVQAGFAGKTIRDLVSIAKSSPAKLSYSSSGSGSLQHLIGEMFKATAGINILHVPYKGSGQGVIGLMTKEVDLTLASPPAVLPHMRSGQLRALAVSSETRSPALPNVPTIAESGYPGFNLTAWFGLMAPGGLPRPINDSVRAVLVKTITEPPIADRLLAEGAPAAPNTPEEFASLIRAELKTWAKAVAVSGVSQ